MHQIVKAIAEKMKLSDWWVQAIAIEYTDCREYATGDEIWKFNFDKVSEHDLEQAVRSHRVVVFGTLVHNVHEPVRSFRAIERLASDIPVRLAEFWRRVCGRSRIRLPFSIPRQSLGRVGSQTRLLKPFSSLGRR